ncbi:MAG: CdaR family protein [Gemmatimonadetes bacterium]|nr:CdaR family protein [Gemmatimonadota bacterium]
MDLGAALTENWPYKVAAIVLSVLLWLSVSADQERADQSIATELVLQVVDSTWSVAEAPAQVFTTFQGRSGDILALLNRPTLRKVIETVEDSVMNISLRPNEVLYDRTLSVRATSVSPDEITVRFERRSGKNVPVRARSDARAADGFMIRGHAVEPESVWIHGPESYVSSIRELDTEPLETGTIDRQVDQQLAVVLPPGMSGVEVTPPSVLVSVHIDPLRTRRFQVVIVPTGNGAAATILDPPSVAVEVTGAAAVVDALAPTDVRVTVDIPETVTQTMSMALDYELPDGVTATATLDPPRVSVAPEAARPVPDPSPR